MSIPTPTLGGRQGVEMAGIFRAYGPAYRGSHILSTQQHRVMRAIEYCRTAALGGHLEFCEDCGTVRYLYRSCGNRHCPKCQSVNKARWIQARCARLLETPYFHIVFTLPHELNALAQGNARLIYQLLFASASQTLQSFGRDERWLGGEIGITMVLHTWGQNLGQHIHVHCVVTGGALAANGRRWIRAKHGFLFPVRALSKVFRGKYLKSLEHAFKRGQLRFAKGAIPLADPTRFGSFLASLTTHDWVVYAKRPFAGPQKVIAYLGRYTHRVAITDQRLLSMSDGKICFRWRDYRHGKRIKTMRLDAAEFIRRFLLHILPCGFMRIRHYGLVASRCQAQKLARCRALLGQAKPEDKEQESVATIMLDLTGLDIQRCPDCQSKRLRRITLLPATPYLTPLATGPPVP